MLPSRSNRTRIEVSVNRQRVLQTLPLVTIFILFVSVHSTFARSSAPQRQVVQAIRVFRSAKGAIARDNAARQLRDVVFAADPKTIDDETIHAMASLLQSREESVRYWIAEALGHFGVRAKFAVPQLRAILDERECMIAETSSVGMIRDTLERIGEPAPQRKCDHYILPK
jgi:HEAT repeat protein